MSRRRRSPTILQLLVTRIQQLHILETMKLSRAASLLTLSSAFAARADASIDPRWRVRSLATDVRTRCDLHRHPFQVLTVTYFSIELNPGQEILREYKSMSRRLLFILSPHHKQSSYMQIQTRVASFSVCEQLDAGCNVDDETVAESKLRQ